MHINGRTVCALKWLKSSTPEQTSAYLASNHFFSIHMQILNILNSPLCPQFNCLLPVSKRTYLAELMLTWELQKTKHWGGGSGGRLPFTIWQPRFKLSQIRARSSLCWDVSFSAGSFYCSSILVLWHWGVKTSPDPMKVSACLTS